MNTFFSDELKNVDTSTAKLDCESQTDKFNKEDGTDGDTYLDSYRAQVSYNNQDEYQCADEIYKALVLANQKGLIGTDTRYDESVTKIEALQFLVDTLESTTDTEKFNYKNGNTLSDSLVPTESSETSTETTSEDSDYELSSEAVADLAKAESESTDPFAGQNVIVDGDFTFASDAAQSDIDQILKARDEIELSVDECDDNGDGLIDKDEAATAAFMYDDETIEAIKSISNSHDDIVNSVVNEILQENSSNSSSSSNSTQGAGKVETWTADPGTTPQIDYSTPSDHTNLDRGVTVY
jgi:hypothetical protein